MPSPYAIAVIGVGKIATDQHLPAIAGDPRFTLAAAVSRHDTIDGLPSFPTIEALIASGIAIDAVAICTPPQVRGDIARAAIAQGWAVMLEKPPAATLAEFSDLVARAEAAGVTLLATWHSRHAFAVAAARDWLAQRTVVSGQVAWREDVRRWHPGQTWLWAPGGLGVFDPGINALSILTAILPEPAFVMAAVLDVPANCHTPIAARIDLRTGTGEIAMELDFLQTGPQSWDMAFETACGRRIALSDGGATLSIDGGAAQHGPEREYPGLYARFADLLDIGASEADPAPLRLVADAFLLGERRTVAAFVE